MNPNPMKILRWQEFSDEFRPHARVLVTGPQRSGTQIAARIVCHETGKRFISYTDMPANPKGIAAFLRRRGFVLHHPSWVGLIPFIRGHGTAILFVVRDLDDIHRSERRVSWGAETFEQRLLGNATTECRPGFFPCQSAEEKHARAMVWHEAGQSNLYFVDYMSLSRHALWVGRRSRSNWAKTRWEK